MHIKSPFLSLPQLHSASTPEASDQLRLLRENCLLEHQSHPVNKLGYQIPISMETIILLSYSFMVL